MACWDVELDDVCSKVLEDEEVKCWLKWWCWAELSLTSDADSLLAKSLVKTCSDESPESAAPTIECSGSSRRGGSGCSSFFKCSNSMSDERRSSSSFSSGSLMVQS